MNEQIKKFIDLEKRIISNFENDLGKSKFKILSEANMGNNFKYDGLIETEEGYPYCIIEVKYNLDNAKTNLNFTKNRIISYTKQESARFAVITDGNTFLFYDSTQNSFEFRKVDYNTIIRTLLSPDKNGHTAKIVTFLNGEFDGLNLSENDICFDENKYYLSLNKEQYIIKKIFPLQEVKKSIYRYTTLNTLFEMLKNNNMRLMGIAGMNDSTEVNFIEKIIYPDALPLNPDINNIFISSCSLDKEDDLTQWRLYAEDGKGVCLKFNINSKKEGFILNKIKYINSKSEEIKKLQNIISEIFSITGSYFVFNTLHEWCHFIKPDDYSVESEVRLLYKLKNEECPKGWIISDTYRIINPYVEFSLDNSFPLKLVEIRLGPKCPEKKINKFQIEQLLKINNKNDVKVTLSSITNYR